MDKPTSSSLFIPTTGPLLFPQGSFAVHTSNPSSRMQRNPGAEISARHLPDVSDASFSFQIPAELNEDLLMDDNEGFLDGLADNFATPVVPRQRRDTLTLSQLTPLTAKPNNQHIPTSYAPPTASALTSSSQFNRVQSPTFSIKTSRGTKTGPKPMNESGANAEFLGEGPSTLGRLDNLKAKVETLFEGSNSVTSSLPPTSIHSIVSSHANEKEKPSHRLRTGQTKLKSAARHAGNTNAQKGAPLSVVTRVSGVKHTESALEDIGSDAKVIVGDIDSSYADTSAISSSDGGLAEKLVKYSQCLIGSQALPQPGDSYQALQSASSASSTNQRSVSADGMSNSDNMPLTLSQLSPSKKKELTSTTNESSERLLRPSQKRPSSDTPIDQPRKKGKVIVPRIRNTASASMQKPMSTSSTSRRTSGRGTTKERSCHGGSLKNMRAKPVMSQRCSSSTLLPVKGESSKSAGAKKMESLVRSTGSSQLDAQQSRQNEPLSTSKPTHSFTFQFHSDMRIEGRKKEREQEQSRTGESKVNRLHTSYHVPDFKSSHMAQGAAMASRKAKLTPVVPLAIEMHTEARAKERSKFDERVKEKEMEMERAREQRRREQEEEEEREIREMRRRAVPKAHEVPEWYKDVPKRKDRRTRTVEEGNN